MLRVLFISIALSLCLFSFSNAAVLDFEDIYSSLGPTSTYIVPDGYRGLTFSSKLRLMTTEFAHNETIGPGYINGMIGKVAAFTSGQAWKNSISISHSDFFDFIGANITSAWKTDQNVNIKGYADSVLKYNTTIYTSSDKAYWFDLNFTGINRLVIIPGTEGTDIFTEYHGNHVVLDNITIVVPEPVSILTFGLGILNLVKRRLRR